MKLWPLLILVLIGLSACNNTGGAVYQKYTDENTQTLELPVPDNTKADVAITSDISLTAEKYFWAGTTNPVYYKVQGVATSTVASPIIQVLECESLLQPGKEVQTVATSFSSASDNTYSARIASTYKDVFNNEGVRCVLRNTLQKYDVSETSQLDFNIENYDFPTFGAVSLVYHNNIGYSLTMQVASTDGGLRAISGVVRAAVGQDDVEVPFSDPDLSGVFSKSAYFPIDLPAGVGNVEVYIDVIGTNNLVSKKAFWFDFTQTQQSTMTINGEEVQVDVPLELSPQLSLDDYVLLSAPEE